MGAGQPNWLKLAEMGKLPKSQRKNIPAFAIIDAAEREIERLKKGMCAPCKEKLFPEADEKKSPEVKPQDSRA